MKIYENFTSDNYIDDNIPAVCIGGFDGVHLGHQELLKFTKDSSNLFQIVTFDILPKKYFNNEHKLLTTNNEKIELFKKFEPSNLVFINFEHVMKFSHKTFCEMLKNNMKAKNIYVGNDFKFGANRQGDVDYLIKYFGEDSVHTIDDYEHKNEKISSTLIRSFLSEGLIEHANEALGYEYSLTGTVIKGDQRGSQIGFPTANLNIDKSIQIPKNGVYKVDVLLNRNLYQGIMNIGYKPTVSEGAKQSLEVHIFDFNDDIYGADLTVHFKKFKPSNLVFINFEHVMKFSHKTFCEMLKNNMKAKNIYVGNDFKFGVNREGDVDYLIKYFGEDSVHTIDDYEHNNEKISSTLIKSFLSEGFVEQANDALGYEYSLTGTVIKGDQRGSQIGFPTANLNIDKNIQIPKNGVYKVDVFLKEYLYKGIMNIGYKPTVSEGNKQSLEVHIFDFNEKIYDADLTVHFKKFIRDEIKFSSIDELIQQISKDIEDINKN